MADAPVPSATRPSRVPSEQDLWTQPEPDDQYADVVSASARTRSLSIGGSPQKESNVSSLERSEQKGAGRGEHQEARQVRVRGRL